MLLAFRLSRALRELCEPRPDAGLDELVGKLHESLVCPARVERLQNDRLRARDAAVPPEALLPAGVEGLQR